MTESHVYLQDTKSSPLLYWSKQQDNYVLNQVEFVDQNNLEAKNPAYGRHKLSRPMRIVGPIQFWRGCVIYRSAPRTGLGPRKNAESVHAKVRTRSTQKC